MNRVGGVENDEGKFKQNVAGVCYKLTIINVDDIAYNSYTFVSIIGVSKRAYVSKICRIANILRQ